MGEPRQDEGSWDRPRAVGPAEEQQPEGAQEEQEEGGQVSLGLPSYLSLRRQAESRAHAHVTASSFVGRAGQEAATFEVTLTLRRDGEGPSAAVALFPADVAVLDWQGPETVYLCSDYGPTQAVLTGDESVTISARVVVGYQTDTLGHCVNLSLPAAPGHQLRFEVPDVERAIRVSPAVEVLDASSEAGSAVTASIGPVQSVRIEWASEQQASSRVRAEVGSVASVGDGRLSMVSHIHYEVRRAGTRQLTLSVPEGAEFLGAEGEGLRGWVVNEQEVLLDFHRLVLGDQAVTVHWEAEIDLEGPIEIPRLALHGVDRESGYLALECRSNIEISEQAVAGATSIDTRDLPGTIWKLCAGPPLLAYRYLEPQWSLTVTVARHREIEVLVAAVDRAFCQSVLVAEGQMETQLRLEVRNNQKQFLRLALPHNAVLWSAFVAGKPVKPSMDHEQHRTLIALEKSASTEGGDRAFPVEIVYVSKLSPLEKKGEVQLFLPAIDMPINHLYFRLFLPECCKYGRFEGGLTPVSEFSHPWPEAPPPEGDPEEAEKSAAGESTRPVRLDLPMIGEQRRFERLLLLEGSCELRFRYKRRWGG